MLDQIISIVGAVFILGAYGANQAGLMESGTRAYSVVNFLGSMLLLWVAVADERVGFIVLESTWALLSVPHIMRPKIRPDSNP